MKKNVYVSVLIGLVMLILVSINRGKKASQINDLLLKNIECLATPENPNVRCYGTGSLDCPGYNIKVRFYL